MRALSLFICGVIIGGGAILPGLSGGILCVAFGIYQPMMELLAHPREALKKNIKIFIPIGIGFVAGFFLFSRIIQVLFSVSDLYTTWLFAGLIAGTMPSLIKQARKKGSCHIDIWFFIAGFLVTFIILGIVESGILTAVKPNCWWYVFCGVLWGFSVIVPGMSSSSILMSLGLYESLNSGIASLSMEIIVPWGIGLIATVFIFAKAVNYLFNKRYSRFFHAVLGIVVSSTIIIIPISGYIGIWSYIISMACFGAGTILSWLLEKMDVGDV